MKLLLTTSIILSTLALATPLEKLPNTFTQNEKKLLLKELSHSSNKLHHSNTYSFKKGWNILTSPKDGVDLEKTFKDNSKVKYITTYEDVSKYWAIYSPNASYPEGKSLFLKYLEPNTTFFVLANEDIELNIQNNTINDACKKLMNDPMFDSITNSALNKLPTLSKNKSISLKTRYFSHNERGLYDESRITLIYPKLNSSSKRSYRYGPAAPKMKLEFTKEYENKKFYAYDHKKQKCHKGVFPSPKIPPFPILQEVK